MPKNETYKFANHKLSEELKDDVGKISLNNDLTTSYYLVKNWVVKLLFLIEKILSYVENLLSLSFYKKNFKI